jgi:nucleoside-diphosphate-sugar epimerase
MGERIIITGGSGFIGSHLIPELLKAGHEVISLERYVTGRFGSLGRDVEIKTIDLLDFERIGQILKETNPSVIINLAALTSVGYSYESPTEIFKIDALASINLAERARETLPNLQQFIHASSTEVYGVTNDRPATEKTICVPNSPYSVAKFAADRYMQYLWMAYQFPVTIMRPTNSITADEDVLLFNSAKLHIVNAETAEMLNQKELSVPSFDFKTHRSELAECASLITDNVKKDCYEITTMLGRKVRVSGDHSVYKWMPKNPNSIQANEFGMLVSTPARELKCGDRIAVAAKLNVYEQDVAKIDLVVYQNSPVRYSGDSKFIRSPYGHDYIRRYIDVTDDALWLFGLFVAEGMVYRNYKTYRMAISSDDDFVLRAVKVIDETFCTKSRYIPLDAHGRVPTLYKDSKALCGFFDIFNKDIPDWIIQLPLARLKHFLLGYFQGDAIHKGPSIVPQEHYGKFGRRKGAAFTAVTTNPKLARKLGYILARFGIVYSIKPRHAKFRKKYGEKSFSFTRVSAYGLNSLDILSWDKNPPTQNIIPHRIGDAIFPIIESIEKVEQPSRKLYDFSVPAYENFFAGDLIICHNTYGRVNDTNFLIEKTITQMLSGATVRLGDPNPIRDWLYIDDHVSGYLAVLNNREKIMGETFNLSTNKAHKIVETVHMIKKLTGFNGTIHWGNNKRPLDIIDHTLDSSKIRNALGWEPKYTLESGLLKTIENMKTSRPQPL